MKANEFRCVGKLRSNRSDLVQFIENLESHDSLEELNLSGNVIRRIEGLNRLVNLRHLNLADNSITRIEHLEMLTALETLNLAGNQIDKIPATLIKLKRLRVLRLARNRLASVRIFLFILFIPFSLVF